MSTDIGRRKRVLVLVEPNIRFSVGEGLTGMGYDFTTFEDSHRALHSIKHAVYDVVLIDYSKTRDNYPFVCDARQMGFSGPVILSTGDTHKFLERYPRALRDGIIDRILEKPFNYKELGKALKEAIESRE
ncbi:MAG: hypothetical protein AABX14_03285 [Candidatus Aenigmatarchaeota archaeon]